ncbi:SAM-dependent methyltransferase [Embleya scabrispora]|uniref:SAM-dependent methyltransferase n=1 Tax=Embleya scabrispora TaxID=159449 RepID=UPI0003632F56|nr:SAM-dependent methyltransferase [Embleya scabrispora]MYS85602.1 SAM-dependent methyltransferase [Streptomyces sp. SID5474]
MADDSQTAGNAPVEPDDWRPVGIDISTPSIARVYDAVLGGKDNYPVDRAIAEASLAIVPEIGDVGRYNRAILGRGVRYMAEQGIRQFLDLGSGLPTVQNTHQVAQEHSPEARVVYVDKDPIVLAHGRALLAENDRTTVVTADLREPAEILNHPDVRALIDFDQPVGLMLVGVVHHLNDDEGPEQIVEAYKKALPPGSFLFLTHFCASSPDAVALEKALLTDLGSGRFRTIEEISAYFDGLELVAPGVVFLPQWQPEEPVEEPLTVGQKLMAGGIAKKPTA